MKKLRYLNTLKDWQNYEKDLLAENKELAALLGELLATLKVNVLRGTISVNGGGIEELEKLLGSFEKRFEKFKPEPIGQTFINPNIDWEKIKF